MINLEFEGFSGGADYANDVHIKLLNHSVLVNIAGICVVLHF